MTIPSSSSSSRRPAPRRSSLTGSSPVTPPPARPGPAPSSPVEPRSGAEPDGSTPTSSPRVGAGSARKTKYPPKVSFYQDPQDTSRVRGAILHTMVSEGPRSLSQFIHHAVMVEVQRLEEKYNGGQPFPPVAPRELPQGRPMGE